ncbi:MAG: AI-2E family transporter [Planctomycetaceae bacterium]
MSVVTGNERTGTIPPASDSACSPESSSSHRGEELRTVGVETSPAVTPGEIVPLTPPESASNSSAGVTPAGQDDNPEKAPQWSERRHHQQQSVSLTVIATLAVLATMAFAKAILFPIILSLLFFLTLRPLVRTAERRGVPPLLSSLGIVVLILASTASAITSLVGPAQLWIDEAPARMQVVGKKLSGVRDRLKEWTSMTDRLQDLATGEGETPDVASHPDPSFLDKLKDQLSGEGSSESESLNERSGQPIAVEVRQPQLMANLQVLNSAGNFVGTLLIVFALGFFLLVEGDVILNNVLGVIPRFTDKKQTVRLIGNIERGISTYLLTVTIINICLGIVIATLMWLLGVPNPLLWGVMATALNFIPFIGAMAGVVIMFLVAVFSFDSLAFAALAPLLYLGVTVIEGNFITPALIGRQVSLNSVAVLLSLIVWGWLWGVGGALIGVPMLIVFRLICDQFEKTASIGALLEGR